LVPSNVAFTCGLYVARCDKLGVAILQKRYLQFVRGNALLHDNIFCGEFAEAEGSFCFAHQCKPPQLFLRN